MKKNILIISSILILLLGIFSCATVHQELDPKIYYKRDMQITFEKRVYQGVAVLPKRDSYSIEFESPGKLDLFTFTTCHRELTFEDANYKFNNKKVKIGFNLKNEMEIAGSCPMQSGAYDIKGKHSWGFLDVESDKNMLPAIIKCNGNNYTSNGVTICQSKEGLIQSIQFPVEVVFSPEASERAECKNIKFENYKDIKFTYHLPNRECVYNFMEIKAPHRQHKLTTIGYENILVREL